MHSEGEENEIKFWMTAVSCVPDCTSCKSSERGWEKIERDTWVCSDFVSRACEVPGEVPPKFYHPLHKPAQKAQQIC